MKQPSIIKKLNLTPHQVCEIIREWYLEECLPVIFQNDRGHDLEEYVDYKQSQIRYTDKDLKIAKILGTELIHTTLSVRTINALGGWPAPEELRITNIKQLVTCEKASLFKFRNFGAKSMEEVEDFLRKNNLKFEMNIGKYEPLMD